MKDTSEHNRTNVEGLVTVWVGPEMKEELREKCKSYGISLSAAARFLFRRWLAAQQKVSRAKEG
jgi:hypothetical protein